MARPALHAALALLVVLAGCSLLAPEPPRDDRAVAELEAAQRALEAVESYRYESDLHAVARDDGRTERVDATVAGAVDRTTRRMNGTTRQDGRTAEHYLLNRTAYRQCGRGMGFWGAENRSAEDWDRLTPAARQLSLLETGALRHGGTATVDGRDATLLVGEPPAKALRQYRDERSQPLFGGPNVRNVTMAVWLDAETSRPVETALSFEVGGRDGSATASMTTRFRAYDEPVAIELPAEVEEVLLDLGC